MKNMLRALFSLAILLVCSSAVAIPNVSFGPLGVGLVDGTSPFGTAQEDLSGNLIPCSSSTATDLAGADCGENNRVVRTQDVATHLWSISVSGGAATIPPGDPVLTDVVIEQIFTPSANAELSVPMPAACTTGAGGGTNPTSSIVLNGDGTTTLTCNLGPFAEGQARIFGVNVQPTGNSWNGSSYTSTQRVFSVDAAGDPNATVNTFSDNRPVSISSAPAYDLIHSISSTQAIRNYSVGNRDVGQGSEPGFYAYMHLRVAATRRFGVETIVQPITINNTLNATSTSVNGPAYPLEFHVTECTPNPTAWGGETFGKETFRLDYAEEYHVIDSGSCSYVRDNPADPTSGSFSVTLQGADLSGTRYPTKAIGNADLTPGPYYVINHRVQIFIPFRTVDLADGIAGNGTGVSYLCSQMNGFDPQSPSGTSNYGPAVEEGYDGTPMQNGTRSNNKLGCTEFKLSTRGSFSKRNLQYSNDRVTGYRYSGTSNYHSGDGELEAGNTHLGWVLVYNSGTAGFNNPNACDIFDNTVEQLTDRGNTGGTPGTYAYMGTYNPNGHNPADYEIQYGNIDLTGDDPLDGNHDGTNDYDLNSGRYNGDWSKQRAARCDDNSTTNGWHTDPNLVTGGIDGVNAARAVLSAAAKAAGRNFGSGHQLRFVVPLMARNTFNGGPHDGQLIPVGTVLPNFGGFKSDEYAPNWTGRNYQPGPENGNVDGDRVTLARIKLALDSHSVTPYAASGATAATIAGNPIIWHVDVALQSSLPNPGNAQNMQIIDVLPPDATYNGTCTANTPGGTPAGIVQYNSDKDGNPAPGYTRLIWNMGNYPANTPIPPRIICTDSNPLAPDGTIVTNYAEVRAENVISSLAARSDTHNIKLEQVGEIQVSKTVDSPLDDMNDGQVYTLSWANFSAALEIAAPVMIDVFPYNGDNNNPQSSFAGVMKLANAPIVTWTDGTTPVAGDPNPDIGTTYYTSDAPATIVEDPDNNTSNWCTQTQFGNPNCPTTLDDVTGIKFVANYDLAKDGNPRQGMKMTLTLLAGTTAGGSAPTNNPADVYTNSFAMDSATLPPAQFLKSGGATVQVASYSIGDFVFADIDENGKYDPLIDYTAPNGVAVNLYKADGTLVGSTTTGTEQPGRFVFNLLGSGDYYVEIPASEFQDNALLEHWGASILSDPTDNDKNEEDDQHAYTTGTPDIDGIRTAIITVSANPAPPGGVPTGNEPTGDNVAFITDSTADDFSNFTLDMGLIPDMYEVSGRVWNDANNNGIRENTELGIAGVTVILSGSPYPGVPVRCRSVDTDANGFYKFTRVLSANYQLIEADAAATPFGGATCPPTDSDPATFVSTTPNVRNITVHETNIERQDFGDYNGIVIHGTVFDDNGLSGGISANGSQESNEIGIGGVKVEATDGTGTVYDTTRTATDGSYTLYVPGTVSDVTVTETNATGYVTTGGQAGDTGGSYDSATDSVTFTATSATTYNNVDFGDVRKIIFEPNHQSEVLPGNIVYYAHQFSTQAAGTVKFTTTADTNTATGWSHVIYRDSNCDGILNGTEANSPLEGVNLGVVANGRWCVINKVYAPANAPASDQYRVITKANFQYSGTAANDVSMQVTDLTMVGSDVSPTTSAANPETGASRLKLHKTAQNISQNGAESSQLTQAKPGDYIKYRLYFRNTGTGEITDLKVDDMAAAFTKIQPPTASCDVVPSGMTCAPVMDMHKVEWLFTGSLPGGASGQVSYQVRIDQ